MYKMYLSLGVVALLCLGSMTEHTLYMYSVNAVQTHPTLDRTQTCKHWVRLILQSYTALAIRHVH